ncbi:MAG: hypothetical protein RBR02_09890 [Desulfuromonadaceae bacterium]|nr:hypothetical protein [Desulfuromonadaceae bacterium]
MPNVDVVKLALIVILVGALVGVGAWFFDEVAPDIVQTGTQATSALEASASGPWGLVVGLFGSTWALAWDIALGFVLLTASVFFILRLIKWVQG